MHEDRSLKSATDSWSGDMTVAAPYRHVRYPIGDQDFKSVREGGFLYVDKTGYIEKLLRGNKYYFLARPRRFGKSLFLTTLRYFFEGRRELFTGLHIDSADWNWQPLPVLYFDLNQSKYVENGAFEDVIDNLFDKWEKVYGVDKIAEEFESRFSNIIAAAHRKTGRQVVILVDEYDKPLVGNLNKKEHFEFCRTKLASIYSNFKSSAEHIRLVFLTGVSRFSKLSVFSDLNNLNDITFDDDFADICGITERELLENFRIGIERLAAKQGYDYEEACRRLKQNYDGYRFAPLGSDIYNPWSVLSCLAKGRFGAYWNATGAASVVAEALRDADVDIEKTLNASWELEDLAGLDLLNADPTSLLYQAGYLTIADYDRTTDNVRLKIPNEEVRKGLFRNLLDAFIRVRSGTVKGILEGIMDGLNSGNPERMMKNLDAYFAGIPYDLRIDSENNFQNAFYILVTLIGADAKAETHTSDGRIDLLIETGEYIYIIELKYDSSPEQALRQIEDKQYARMFDMDPRVQFRIGVSFSSEKRRIEGWKIVGPVS